MPTHSSKEKQTEYTRHKSYLQKLKHSSLFCPRYDMLSLNNNLLLHRNFDPRKELLPRRPSQGIRELEEEIKRKTAAKGGRGEGRPSGPKWYEAVLRNSEAAEKRFPVEYVQAASSGFSVRESLNRLYNTRGKACSRERGRGGSFYSGQGGRLE